MSSRILYPDFRSFEGGFMFENRRYPAVTWVLRNGIPTEFDDWYARMAADWVLDHVEREPDGRLYITDQTKSGPVRRLVTRQHVMRRAVAAAVAYRDDRMRLGSEVHRSVKHRLLGVPVNDFRHPHAGASYAAFVEFCNDFELDVEAAEATGFNDQTGYGGTIDVLGTVTTATGRERWLIDLKCAANVQQKDAVQLAALAHLEYLVTPSAERWPMPTINRAVILRVTPDGYAAHGVDTGPATWQAFRGALKAVAPWRDRTAPHVDLGVIKPAPPTPFQDTQHIDEEGNQDADSLSTTTATNAVPRRNPDGSERRNSEREEVPEETVELAAHVA